MPKPGASTREANAAISPGRAFDMGINERLPLPQLVVLALQNVFGMTGMFVFPGILGRAFHLADAQIAYLYGMTFMACGIITILQSVLLLRLPIAQAPTLAVSARFSQSAICSRAGSARRSDRFSPLR